MRIPLILTILLILSASPLSAQPLTPEDEQEARRIFLVLGCRGCHDFEQSGSNIAPSLDRIGLRLNEAQILERLQTPPTRPGTGKDFMPSYRTTPLEQLKLLSRYLAGRK